jgi:2-succinyl-5-enolpyruvyl-6-hydroxy-3-cyclohexene-1-carboxylate synthase
MEEESVSVCVSEKRADEGYLCLLLHLPITCRIAISTTIAITPFLALLMGGRGAVHVNLHFTSPVYSSAPSQQSIGEEKKRAKDEYKDRRAIVTTTTHHKLHH